LHTNKLKPHLTEENKVTRLSYAALEVQRKPGGGFAFPDGDDIVHIDEKWFWMTEECVNYYLGLDEDEEEPEEPVHQTVRHKNHIER